MAPSPGACSTACWRSRGCGSTAISGTSAGAMNAAVLADGWTRGRRRRARGRRSMAIGSAFRKRRAFSPLQRSPLDRLMGRWSLDTSPAYVAMDLMSRVLSPYDSQSARATIRCARSSSRASTFERLARRRSSCSSPRPMCEPAAAACSATARSRPMCCSPRRVCRPCSRRSRSTASPIGTAAIAGNPTITPLVRESEAHDTILVQINPRERPDTPRTASEILNRLNEISFNSPLMKELRMIALLRQVADPGTGEGARWARMRTHRIMTDMLAQFGASSKLNAEWDFVTMLREEGRTGARANSWRRMATISASAPRPISTCCWRSADR